MGDGEVRDTEIKLYRDSLCRGSSLLFESNGSEHPGPSQNPIITHLSSCSSIFLYSNVFGSKRI